MRLTLAIALATGCAMAHAQDAGKAITGKALQQAFADHEYGDGVHFSYEFRADGTFSGTEMAKDVRGTWRSSGREICWKWIRPPAAEECYTARRLKDEVTLYRNGYEQWFGKLKPITK